MRQKFQKDWAAKTHALFSKNACAEPHLLCLVNVCFTTGHATLPGKTTILMNKNCPLFGQDVCDYSCFVECIVKKDYCI